MNVLPVQVTETSTLTADARNCDVVVILIGVLLSVGSAETRLMHRSLPRLIVLNPVLVPPVHVERRERPLSAKVRIMGEKMAGKI
jgi:hypothetical protein